MTQEKFETYYAIQMSGVTNMFAIKTVIELSRDELMREDCLDIMKNYNKYKKEYIK